MTKVHANLRGPDLKALPSEDGDFPRSIMNVAVRAVLEVEVTDALSDEKGAHVDGQRGCRSG